MSEPKHPMQPIAFDECGVIRFKKNSIVSFLLDACRQRNIADMNLLAAMPFSAEDRNQFAQLIGYSVSGFGDLSYADPTIVAEADRIAAEPLEAHAAD